MSASQQSRRASCRFALPERCLPPEDLAEAGLSRYSVGMAAYGVMRELVLDNGTRIS